MSLPMLRGCSKFPPTFSFTRLFVNESLVLNRSGNTLLNRSGNTLLNRSGNTRPPRSSPAAVAASLRPYSSDRGGHKPKKKVTVVGIPNPFIWFRTRIYYFLIKAYFDKDFTIEEFTEGAKQAFSHVSTLLSQCQFEALEGLVAKDLIGKLEEKCNLLPLSHRKALSADPDEIMHTIAGDVGIYYDDTGRKFVSILMRFWYLTSAHLPNDTMEGARVFRVVIGGMGEAKPKRLLTANYEFQREFTKGVPPEWTITRIEHSKLLD